MIELQLLSADDWRLWRELRLRALAEAPYAFGSSLGDWESAGEERWRQRLDLPGSHNLVARLDGRPLGMASGVPVDEREHTAEVIGMWVAPEARGRGVGDALIAEVARWARERGAPELRLDVVEGNAHAIALYTRHGFVDAGPAIEAGERLMAKPL